MVRSISRALRNYGDGSVADNPTPNDTVRDDELLFRRIPDQPAFYEMRAGKLRLSRNAFSDAHNEPSVERAAYLEHAPLAAITKSNQGIVCLRAGEVRDITERITAGRGNGIMREHRLDVVAAPSNRSAAHAVIAAQPPIASASSFAKVAASLARLADKRGWLITPPKVCQSLR